MGRAFIKDVLRLGAGLGDLAGIDVVNTSTIVFAHGCRVSVASRIDGTQLTVLNMERSSFCGVAVNRLKNLYVVDRDKNAVHVVLKVLEEADDDSFATPFNADSVKLVLGGNAEYPSGFQYEGSKVRLWCPSFLCFVHDDFILMNGGASLPKVFLITNLTIFAREMLPLIQLHADIFALTEDPADHACNIAHAIPMLAETRDFLDAVEAGNLAITGRRGGQGPDGNFSNCIRSAARADVQTLSGVLAMLDRDDLRVPSRCSRNTVMAGATSLPVEKTFVAYRHHDLSPTSLAIKNTRSKAVAERHKITSGNLGFSYFTGRVKSQHYIHSGSEAVAATLFVRKKRNRVAISDAVQRRIRLELEILRQFQKLFPAVRTTRVTDCGKERFGAEVAYHYEPRAVPALAHGIAAPRHSLSVVGGGRVDHVASGQSSLCGDGVGQGMLYRVLDLVFVRAVNKGGVWMGQLMEALVITEGRPAKARLNITYFVDLPTELSRIEDEVEIAQGVVNAITDKSESCSAKGGKASKTKKRAGKSKKKLKSSPAATLENATSEVDRLNLLAASLHASLESAMSDSVHVYNIEQVRLYRCLLGTNSASRICQTVLFRLTLRLSHFPSHYPVDILCIHEAITGYVECDIWLSERFQQEA